MIEPVRRSVVTLPCCRTEARVYARRTRVSDRERREHYIRSVNIRQRLHTARRAHMDSVAVGVLICTGMYSESRLCTSTQWSDFSKYYFTAGAYGARTRSLARLRNDERTRRESRERSDARGRRQTAVARSYHDDGHGLTDSEFRLSDYSD